MCKFNYLVQNFKMYQPWIHFNFQIYLCKIIWGKWHHVLSFVSAPELPEMRRKPNTAFVIISSKYSKYYKSAKLPWLHNIKIYLWSLYFFFFLFVTPIKSHTHVFVFLSCPFFIVLYFCIFSCLFLCLLAVKKYVIISRKYSKTCHHMEDIF